MKLNRTRKEWRDQIYRRWQPGMQIPQVLADIETLFAEVDRLTAQLAERDRELHEERMRHLVTMTESYGGYDKEFPPFDAEDKSHDA